MVPTGTLDLYTILDAAMDMDGRARYSAHSLVSVQQYIIRAGGLLRNRGEARAIAGGSMQGERR